MKKRILSFVICLSMVISMLPSVVIFVSAATTVDVSTVEELQSAHSYSNNMDTTWVYTQPGAADSLKITFSSDTKTESNFDYIYIMDGDGREIGKYSGTSLAGVTVSVPGNVVKIRLTSDGSNTGYGFRVTAIDAVNATGPITNLRGMAISNSAMRFTFSSPAGATSVVLEYSTDGESWNAAPTEELTAETTRATVTNLESGNKYWFRLNVEGGDRAGISNVCVRTLGYTAEEDFIFSGGVIKGYSGTETDVVIPYSIGGVTVTAIGANAFKSKSSLTSITIPENVTSIGECAFADCTGLTQINWNAVNVSDFYYRDYVFDNAGTGGDGIEVVFGEKVVKIPAYCFCPHRDDSSYAPKITSVTIGENVTSIGNYAFADCTGLTQINWNAKNVSDFYYYNNYVFKSAGTSGDGIEVVFGEKVERIPAYCFCPCSGDSIYAPKITSVTIGENVTSIGKSAFSGCGYPDNSENWENGYLYMGNHLIDTDKTMATAVVKEGTLIIADGAFSGNTELLRVTLPGTLKSIGGYAFSECNNLLRITIPEGVTTIGECAFYNCSDILKINIPSTVTSIGGSAFGYCYSLEGVYITDLDAWCNIEFKKHDSYLYNNLETNPLYYAQNLYINDELVQNIVIGEGITEIGDYLFANCDSIKSVTLPESLTSIGSNAFYDCDSLTNINIPANVNTIGSNAFYDCPNLKYVHITDLSAWCRIPFDSYDENPLNQGGALWLNGEEIENLVIPEDITVLNRNTFYNCDGLTSVVLHDNVEKVEEQVFYDCDNIRYAVIPKDILYIKNYSFNGCDSLKYVFYKGNKALWEDMLIYSGNDSINSAEVICNAEKKTYSFVTNSDATIDSITDYCIAESPNAFDVDKSVSAWYTNEDLSGTPVEFPYCGDATTLYATWGPRGGTSLKDALFVKTNQLYQSNSGWETRYLGFIPTVTGEYRIYSHYEGSVELCDEKGIPFMFSSGSIPDFTCTLNQGEIYYIVVTPDNYNGVNLCIEAGEGIEVEIPYSGTCGDNMTWELTPDGTLTISGTGEMYWFDNYTPKYWQVYKSKIKNVVIEEGVGHISNYAFYDCSEIEKVTLPSTLTSMGYNAFYGCTKIKAVDVNSLEWWSTFYGKYNLFECALADNAWDLYENGKLVEYLVIPQSVTWINGGETFKNCRSIKSVTFHNEFYTVPAGCFENCVNLAEINFSSSVQSIGKDAFSNTAFYKNRYNWKNNMLCIGNCLIKVKNEVSGEFRIPSEIKYIAASAFEGTNITKVYIHSNVNNMQEAFAGAEKLVSAVIEEGIRYIPGKTFYGCTNLSEIIIPLSVYQIETDAFTGTSFFNDESNWENNGLYAGKVLVAVRGDSSGEFVVREGTTGIGAGAFRNAGYTGVVLPESLKYIGGQAFYECKNLTEIVLPENVMALGWGVFGECTSLKTVTLADGITQMSNQVFRNCTALETIYNMPLLLEWYGTPLFENCTSLKDIYYEGTRAQWQKQYDKNDIGLDTSAVTVHCAGDTRPAEYCGTKATWSVSDDGVLTIGGTGKMFDFEENARPWEAYKENIVKVVIGDGITRIGDHAFSNCDNLAEVRISSSVVSVGACAFSENTSRTNIKKVYIYDLQKWCQIEFEQDNSNPLQGCAELYLNDQIVSELVIPEGTEMVCKTAFLWCDSITSVTIPASVRSIGARAFYGCRKLEKITVSEDNPYYSTVNDVLFNKDKTEILQYPRGKSGSTYVIPQSVEKVSDRAFTFAYNLQSITVPAGVSNIGMYAFSFCGGLKTLIVSEDNPYFCTVDGNLFSKDKTQIVQYFSGGKESTYAIPDGVTTICENAFCGSEYLTSVTMPDSVTTIGENAFSECYALTEVTLSPNITAISNSAFSWCRKLQSVVIPDGVTSISWYAFNSCKELQSITIPASVNKIESSAFSQCPKLTIKGEVGSYAQTFANQNGIPFSVIGVEPDEPEYMKGDINGDGRLNARDVIALRRHIAGGYDGNVVVEELCDFNGDTRINARDVIALRQYIVG